MSSEAGGIGSILGLRRAILQAGMGGVAGPGLAAAVSEAGGGGQVGLYRMPAENVHDAIASTRSLTSASFGVNVIAEVAGPDLLRQQLDVVVAMRDANIFVTTFGPVPAWAMRQLVVGGVPVLVQVGSVADARDAMGAGATAVILQGTDAGGHHLGTHTTADLRQMLAMETKALPALIAGGVGNADDVQMCLDAGAIGVMCGTCFVVAEESDAHQTFKDAVCQADETDTVVTSVFDVGWPGRPHRVLANETAECKGGLRATFLGRTTVAGRDALVPRYSAAVPTVHTQGNIMAMAMYAGTSCSRVKRCLPASDIVASLTN